MTGKRLATFSVALILIGAMVPATALAKGGGPGTSVIYSSYVGNPLVGNLPSVGGEAYAFDELGNAITFAGTNRKLTNVVVTMSSWACVSGAWFSDDCTTPAGSTFTLPITFNIYGPSVDGGLHPGSLVATSTQTFSIPYRPSASPKCTGDDAGKWYDPSSKTCFNGLATNITFNFSGVDLPDSVVFGIAYDTTHFGYTPIGESAPCYGTVAGCPYDSLNIALSSESATNPSAGSDVTPGTIWQNSPYGNGYCDGGTAGTDVFRLDSPSSACWAPYIPAVQFKAGGGNS